MYFLNNSVHLSPIHPSFVFSLWPIPYHLSVTYPSLSLSIYLCPLSNTAVLVFPAFQLEESVQVLRRRIEPEVPVKPAPAPPSAPLPDPTPMEEEGVDLASPTAVAPPPPLPEGQSEGEQADQQQDESQEDRQEDAQQLVQPPPPSGMDELLTPKEPQDSAGSMIFFLCFWTHTINTRPVP